MNQIQYCRERLWWALTLELSEQSILQARLALEEADLLASLKKEVV